MDANGQALLQLIEGPYMKRYQRMTGLYILAILCPDQRELARAIACLIILGTDHYPTDHVSLTLKEIVWRMMPNSRKMEQGS
jgi:catechol-2,3-dioxygenase